MSENTKKPKAPAGLMPVGDILGTLFSAQEFTAPKTATDKTDQSAKRKQNTKLARAAAAIAARPDATEAAYLARELVQCTLPHRNPGDVAVWVRRNGNFALGLQPGADLKSGGTLGLPYGSIPRLILLWIVTEAVRTKSRHIKLGGTLNDFLREIGLDPKTGRGKRGDATRLKDQLTRLLRCRISFEYNDDKRQSWLDMQVAPKGELWWDDNSPDQATIFESHIILGEEFFKAITSAPVPIDLRALLPLKQSPLAIDLYTWATYRLHTMQRAGMGQIKIPLTDLQEQFGSEYSRLDNFKAAFVEALAKVQEVFPALDYAFEDGALVLRDSKKRPAIAPSDKTAARQRLQEFQPLDEVSAKARQQFKQEFPLWDVEAVLRDFYAWREDKKQTSASTDRHFKAFARTWVERNR